MSRHFGVVEGGDTIAASFTVTNTGERDGTDVPQLYLTHAAGNERMRLLGFERVELVPGETRRVTLRADHGCSRASMPTPASG